MQPVDLRTLPLHGTFSTSEGFAPLVQAFRESIQQADAICWVTPTYHNMLPAVALNALNLLDFRVMARKANGIVGATTPLLPASWPKAAAIRPELCSSCRCVSITPLGAAVEPEVN